MGSMLYPRRHYGIAAAAAFLVVATMAFALWWRSPRADLSPWLAGPPPAGWASRVRQEEKWRAEGVQRHVDHEYRPLAAISIELQLAVLVSEDIDFFGHGALDVRALWQAIDEWRHGGRLRGASTITQQLAKTLFLSPERSLRRKLEEIRLAWWLEHDLGKPRILELYLNVVEFGPGALGAQAAARRYFAVDAGDLTPGQAAGLAAAIPSPGRDNAATATRRWATRRSLILGRMRRAIWLRHRLERMPGAVGREAG
jgi:monofunctional biosynthetic peptidoglycan transglycosylase